MRITAVSCTTLDEHNIDVIGFAEAAEGDGRSIIIQLPRELDEDDEDTYRLSNERGSAFCGGLEQVDIDRSGHSLVLTLSSEAAATLDVPAALHMQLDLPASGLREEPFLTAIEPMLTQQGIAVYSS